MHRYSFPLFIIFLFSYITSYAQQLVLEKVSVDTVTQKITISWLYNSEIDSITIYKCNNNCNEENFYYKVDKVKLTDLEWADPMATPTSQNYYCIGWKASGKSAPQNNIVLQATLSDDSCKNSVLLSWNPYINIIDTLDYYSIYYRKKDIDTFFVFLDTLHGTHFEGFYFEPEKKISYPVKYLSNNTNYEFVIQAVNRTKKVFSVSNIVEFETMTEVDTLVPVNIESVSVIDDSYIQIDVTTDPYYSPFTNLLLLRYKPENANWNQDYNFFKVVDTLEYDSTNFYSFIDKYADPKLGLYYYLSIAENGCKLNDTSNILTNIFLYGWREEKYKDSVFFLQAGFPNFDLSEPKYELLRIVLEDKLPIASHLNLKYNYCFVDVLPFLNDGLIMQYQIKSVTNGGYSNILTIEHEPIVSFANAFYPHSLNIENRTFYPIIKFPPEGSYLFVIYNRWGQELFRSTHPPVYGDYENMQGRWDGTFRGKECPAGFYAFQLSFSYNESSRKYSESGSFMLVR
ncbi:MAG: hypothetical protein LBU83_07995 [Bacteroidales bacterium]|jgi:hypothetical protein|nr:hypothetical protein [Bacteroidales bacterium]